MTFIRITGSLLIFILSCRVTLLSQISADGGETKRKYSDIQWISDMDSMYSFMKRIHPNLYWKTPEAVFNKEIDQIKAAIPELTDSEIITRFSKLVSLVNDGHTLFMGSNISDKYFPVRIESFTDGYFVTAISKQYSELYGAEVIKIGNYSSAEAFEKIGSITSADKSYSKQYWTTRNLTMSSLLTGLGIINSPGVLDIEIVDKDNRNKIISVKAEKYPFKDDPVHKWLWMSNSVPDSSYLNLFTETRYNPPLRLKNFERPTYIIIQQVFNSGFWVVYLGQLIKSFGQNLGK